MNRWQLTPHSPLALQLAADARLSQTDYFDDQVWELALGTPGNPALALQTNYGGRIGLASLLPMWRIDNRAVYQYQAYSSPPVIAAFAPGYAQASAMITPKLALRVDFWAMDSHAVGARLTVKNSGTAVDLGLDLVGFAAAEKRELKLSIVTNLEGNTALSLGKIGGLNPMVLLENARSGSGNTLNLDFKIPANGQFVVRWVHAGRADPAESESLAQKWLKQNWNTSLRRITQAAQAIPAIETGDETTDAVLAFAYQQLIQSFLKPTASLPYPSFVATRQPGRGYSPRGDGTDHPRSWSGQTPTLAYVSALALAPINAEMAQGILRNYLAIQRPDGWIDWKPGLAGQQQGVLCLPILARLTWGIWQYTEDDKFLQEVFPGLLRFFERWLAEDVDGDGFPEWQSETQMGYPFMPSFALGLPWGQNADIRYFETPDLLAYLLSEAISLREIAYYLQRASDEERLGAQVRTLTERLESLWNASEQRYTYRDRDTHRTSGSFPMLQDGRGDENHILALRLDPPNRLIVRITGGADHIPKIKLRLSGLDMNGQRIEEETETLVWTPGRGVYTSRTVFSQIDRIRAEGLSGVYRISAQTVDTTGFDLNGVLPLWSVGIAPERAAALIQHLTNPAEFWRKNGLLMFSAQDAHFDPARAEGSLGVWLYWLTLIGEGLIEQERVDLAAELVKRILAVQVTVLRDAKAFYEFYHADEARGLGERGSTFGLAPLHLLLRVLGVRILSKTRVWTGGSFPWGSPVSVTLHGVTVRRSVQGTEIRFPSGNTVNLPANAPWQEVNSPKSS
jgi:Mannosylglycerate hydrolase MGH1-like glycoside hydrolase domain